MTTPSTSKRALTVADVAREAQVSKAQAARALGGYGAVSDKVRSRVAAAAERLSYRPNQLARSMNTGRSQSLGVVVGDIENPYFGLAVRGISDLAKEQGYDVILINTDENLGAEQDAVRVLVDKRVDGLIVAPCSADDIDHLAQVVEESRILVLFDRMVEGLGVETVAASFEAASRQATELLLDSGHRRIAYVTSLSGREPFTHDAVLGFSPIAQRVAGMKQAFLAYEVEFDPALVKLNAGREEDVQRILDELLAEKEPPTALVASDNRIAQALLKECRRRSLRIPVDFSFVMYDDFPWTELVDPPLTVVTQPVYAMGQEVARRTIARIKGEDPGPMPAFEAVLIRRASISHPG
ncbi:LacI family DNA-binding transcriptional regulator [Halomonas sp. DN3]|uniref:LacI family DNA-binding transcriptional regulator n=1 Tax=Halomonas sp. DN3 TaxID=2953657 RepID=UPI00209C864B|nr:LacI family DNA-binding transcriptional regulator [Halomonas sp. DN3]USZ50419.1 LacI family transcriptional regulator [Halomonas sp. DN3]